MKRTLRPAGFAAKRVKKVTASQLGGHLRDWPPRVSDNKVLLVQDRRQKEKYVVDKKCVQRNRLLTMGRSFRPAG